jgi:hypothetical protein
MKNRTTVIALMIFSVLAAVCCFQCAGPSQRPALNVSSERHPNLAAAQDFLLQAYDRVVDAQKANEWDLGGHAEKAKVLIDQADDEIKLAAEAANERRGK